MSKKIFGRYKIEMKNYQRIQGYDDSLSFHGELWVNKTHIADCWNYGSQGDTCINIVNHLLFNEVAKVVCSNKILYKNIAMNYTIPLLAEELAYKCHLSQSIKDNQKNNLVFILDDIRMKLISFKSKKQEKVDIAEMLLSDNGRKLIKDAIMKYEKNGWKLANTNIKKVLI